jgi:hypothetical protein
MRAGIPRNRSGAARSQSPFLGRVGFPRTDRQKQTLRRCPIRADAFLKLGDRPKSPRRPRIFEHLTKRPLFSPFWNRVHAFPPSGCGETLTSLLKNKRARSAAIRLDGLNFGKEAARSHTGKRTRRQAIFLSMEESQCKEW